MYFVYGSFTHALAEVMVTFFGATVIYNPRGRPQWLRKRMVVEGEIVADTTAIDTRMQLIIDAYAVNGGSASLLRADGSATAYNLPSPGSISGVRIIQPPTFFQQDGKAHMATGLPFSIILEADYPINDGDSLVTYSETITYIGTGMPRVVTLELDSQIPIKQTVSTNTIVTVIQSGEAVGSLAYPLENPPIFPNEVDQPEGYVVSRTAPRLDGQQFVDWAVRWQYRMSLTSFAFIPSPILR